MEKAHSSGALGEGPAWGQSRPTDKLEAQEEDLGDESTREPDGPSTHSPDD